MLYVSTRGQAPIASAAHVIKEGLARDGGLFVPQNIPKVHLDDILTMHAMPYSQCVASVLKLFLTDYTVDELLECAEAAYTQEKFGNDPVPLAKVSEETDVLELWHGPTMAFKDMALQILPHLMTRAQKKIGEESRIVILAATSGDTGKAALEGFADVPGTDIIVFYPTDGVSPIQKLQMTTQKGGNVAVFGIEGDFDDAQRGVKEIFSDQALEGKLAEHGYCFSSANSINWGRLAPQIAYYFKAYASAVANGRIKPGDPIIYAVPTGNFGDILAGYYAKRMGLPVKRFICASNSNNVLTEFINTGKYNRKRDLLKTSSPSMDILVSSNLERLLYDVTEGDQEKVAGWMKELQDNGFYEVDSRTRNEVQENFFGAWADEMETGDAIGRIYNDYHYLMDPHTAVAWKATEKYRLLSSDDTYAVVLSTASPYKFNKAVLEGLGKGEGVDDSRPFEAVRKLHQETELPLPRQMGELEKLPVLHEQVIEAAAMPEAICTKLGI